MPVTPQDHYGDGSKRYVGRGAPVSWTLTPRVAQRRERMRDIGAYLFATQGVDRIGILDVARAADVPASASSHGYRRRQELIFDILYAHVDVMHEYVGSADDAFAQANPGERFDAVIAALLDGLHEHRHANRVLIRAFAQLPDEQHELLRYLLRTLTARIAGPLEAVLPGLAKDRILVAPLLQSLMGMATHAPEWLKETGALTRHEYAHLIARALIEGGRAMLTERRSRDRGASQRTKPLPR
ncbi:MAG: TetR/AcrR family transcriptional regulator [Acetobacteraceae bacterium]